MTEGIVARLSVELPNEEILKSLCELPGYASRMLGDSSLELCEIGASSRKFTKITVKEKEFCFPLELTATITTHFAKKGIQTSLSEVDEQQSLPFL